MKLYVAGRIANEPGYKAKFAQACTEVLLLDHIPISPTELHDGCNHQKWEEWMCCDIHALLDCDGVYALRDWKDSPGATVEVELAIKLKKEIIYQ